MMLGAKQIREIRENAGMSVRAFSQALGVSPSAVSRWENGLTQISEFHSKLVYDVFIRESLSDTYVLSLISSEFEDEQEVVQFIRAYTTAEPNVKEAIKILLGICK